MDFVTLISTLLYHTNINAFGAPVKILQQLQKCDMENADLLRVAHIQNTNTNNAWVYWQIFVLFLRLILLSFHESLFSFLMF